MFTNKEIIVVSPEDYTEFARKIAHEISKVKGFNGANWTIKQYEDNEFQLGSNRYAIFIGNSDENKLTKDFLPVITNLKNKSGACYGFDGSKAVAFGEGILSQEKEFKKVIKEATAAAAAAATTAAATGSMGAIIISRFIMLFPLLWFLVPGFFLYQYLNKKNREKKLRREQTKVALTFFMLELFKQWINTDN